MIGILAFLRSLISVLFLFPFWTVGLSFLALVQMWTWNNSRVNHWFVETWTRGVCWMFGVRPVAIGAENIPAGTCLFLFNHASFFDIFSLNTLVPDMRFGAKIELFSIPVFGPTIRKIGVLPIARGNVESVLKVYKAAEARAAAGDRFALSPEGGRNTSGEKLLRFKSGPFLFAVSAQTPIVPVVIKGAKEVWPKGSLVPQTQCWTSIVEVHFLPAISVRGLGPEAKTDLQEKTHRAMMEKMIEIGYQ